MIQLSKLFGGTRPKEQEKSVQEMVQEIHETFYTEVDRLLAHAGILEPVDESNKEAIEKMRRLSNLGFFNAKEVKEGESVRQSIEEVRKTNEARQKLKEAILYFQQKYPMYKFITEIGVQRICEKYNLVYGPVSNYLGNVPEKNLIEIENFNIQEEDVCVQLRGSIGRYDNFTDANKKYNEALKEERKVVQHGKRGYAYFGRYSDIFAFEECPLEIAAPIKDFDTSKMVLTGRKLEQKIEIPDPVVLQPVFHSGQKHYLIVTAWGDEAADPEVMNPIHN